MDKDLPSCPGCGHSIESCICGSIGKYMTDWVDKLVIALAVITVIIFVIVVGI